MAGHNRIDNINKSTVHRRGRGRQPTNATPVLVRLMPDQLAALDGWIARCAGEGCSRPDAIRQLLVMGLQHPRARVRML